MNVLRPGHRVRLVEASARYHGCDWGTVHAIWLGTEDTIEVLLDNGTYACFDPEHIAFPAAAVLSAGTDPP